MIRVGVQLVIRYREGNTRCTYGNLTVTRHRQILDVIFINDFHPEVVEICLCIHKGSAGLKKSRGVVQKYVTEKLPF